MQRREKPTFHACRVLELISFVCPNVESLLCKVSCIVFVSGQTQAKPIQVAVVKFHETFELQVGGHLAVIPKWESSAAHLFPLPSKNSPKNGRECSSNFFGCGNNNDSGASHPKRTHERKPNLFLRSRNVCCYTTGCSVVVAHNSDKSWSPARSAFRECPFARWHAS